MSKRTAIGALGLWLLAAGARAEPPLPHKAPAPRPAKREAAPKPSPAQESAAPNGPKELRLDALNVEGKIEKPEAFYILKRSSPSFDELKRGKSFLRKIEDSVETPPF